MAGAASSSPAKTAMTTGAAAVNQPGLPHAALPAASSERARARSANGQPESRVRATAMVARGAKPRRRAVRISEPQAQVSQARLTRAGIQLTAPQAKVWSARGARTATRKACLRPHAIWQARK